jgi:PTH1 family peptidyl-tRNA hydrolase
MNREIKLFVGLGNPGQKYENTRHNLGFIILDEIAVSRHLEFKAWDIANVSFYNGVNSKIWLLKPMTFMNLSGTAVASFAKYYKINPEEIFVFYDDFSIPLGEYRIRMSGSAGGHNGISSIIDHLNTNNFPRMKLGIGPLPGFMKTEDFVLSKFNQEDKEKIDLMKKTAVNIYNEVNLSGVDKAASMLANKKRMIQEKNNSPKTGCVKGFVNGSCGSFVNGKCEVDHTKDCVWVLIYENLKKTNSFEKFINQYIEPKNKMDFR